MPYPIEEIEGIGNTYGERLRNLGINTTENLLEKAATKKARQHLAQQTEIPESLIQTWVNHAELMRINGIAAQFAELLEAAEVDSVKTLSKQNANTLLLKLQMVNEQFGLTGRLPSLDSLKEMISEAKKLAPKKSN